MATRSASLLLVLGALTQAACSEQPGECLPEPLTAMATLAKEAGVELAPRSLETAQAEVAKAQAYIAEQQARLKLFRRWDAERCRAGLTALDRARADVAQARAARDVAGRVEQSTREKLARARQDLAALAAFVDGGVVGPELAAKAAQARGEVEALQGKIALALGEVRSAGFVAPTTTLERSADDVDAAGHRVAGLARDAMAEANQRCRPRLGGEAPSFTLAPRVLQDWMVWRGDVGGRAALFVFRLDRERRACRLVGARAETSALSSQRDEQLHLWRAAGRLPQTLLVGWGEHHAWFALPGGGLSAFSHESAARFVSACRGRVRCDKPALGATTVEADCACAFEDLEIAIADRNRRVRYVWDGRSVRAEL